MSKLKNFLAGVCMVALLVEGVYWVRHPKMPTLPKEAIVRMLPVAQCAGGRWVVVVDYDVDKDGQPDWRAIYSSDDMLHPYIVAHFVRDQDAADYDLFDADRNGRVDEHLSGEAAARHMSRYVEWCDLISAMPGTRANF